MTVHDGDRLQDAPDDLRARSLTPTVMLADSHYGSSDNMALTHQRDIDLVAPARPAKSACSGQLTLEDFVLDETGLVVLCPNEVKPISTSAATAKLQARFDLSICRQCSNARYKRPSAMASLPAFNIRPRGPPIKSAGFESERGSSGKPPCDGRSAGCGARRAISRRAPAPGIRCHVPPPPVRPGAWHDRRARLPAR